MKAEVKFKDGYVCIMELIYNWNGCHMYRTDTCYLIVPYKDVAHSKVPVEEFMAAQKAAKAMKKEIQWSEIKST